MAEFTNAAVQTVAPGNNVLFNETAVKGCHMITHRDGSGLVGVKGYSDCYKTLYSALFNANIAIPTGGTVGPISLALALNGEPLQASLATVTPAAVEEFFNVSIAAEIAADCGCCLTVAVENTTDDDILVQNANLIVKKSKL